MKRLLQRPLPAFLASLFCYSVLACGGEGGGAPTHSSGGDAGSGGSASGGANSSGGAGAVASGGAAVSSGGSGGANASGGALVSTGGTGGATTSGGAGPVSGGGGASATGGMAADGGSPSGDGGSVSGVGGSPPAGVLFMTDFESEATGTIMTGGASWTTTLPTEYDSMGVVEVVEGQAHSGNKAVRVVKGNDGQAFLQLADASVFPFTGSVLFVRAFIKLAIWPENHASWIEVGAATNETSEIRLGAHQGVLQVNHYSGKGEQDQIAPDVAMTTDTWHCLEMSYEPGQKAVQVWLDNEPVPALTVMGSFERGDNDKFDPAPPLEAVRFGAEIAATEAWFDDIAVGTEYIGCD